MCCGYECQAMHVLRPPDCAISDDTTHYSSCVGMQVYDLRSVPRMTSSFAFNSGPTLLKFHPKLSSTLLVASARGVFTLADAGGATYSRYEQVCITTAQCGVGSD